MKRALKWVGIVLGSLVVLVLVAAAVLYMIGGSKASGPVTVQGQPVAITADSASLAWGHHLTQTLGCRDCHTENLAGQVFIDAPPFLVVASNLTPGAGGVGAQYTEEDWERAIRHGVNAQGRGLMPMMPSPAYSTLSDDETASLIAYLRTLPPVDNELPATELRPLGRIIMATGGLPLSHEKIDHAMARPPRPAVAATAEYGAYRSVLCGYCHGADLRGAESLEPGAPPPPDLAVVQGWGLEAFRTMMRTGVTPDGRELDPLQMPWTAFRHMTDEEIEALYLHLSTLVGQPDDTVTETAES